MRDYYLSWLGKQDFLTFPLRGGHTSKIVGVWKYWKQLTFKSIHSFFFQKNKNREKQIHTYGWVYLVFYLFTSAFIMDSLCYWMYLSCVVSGPAYRGSKSTLQRVSLCWSSFLRETCLLYSIFETCTKHSLKFL